MTHYPDTEEGVRAMLKEQADPALVPSSFQADPYVNGCWLVTCTNGVRLLAYVGTHPMANDFEEVE